MLSVSACGGSTESRDEILVSAASSLTDVFGEIGDMFEAEHPGADVVFNFAASSTLREQILQGAPVDVFASADIANMERATDDHYELFASNRARIAVPTGNPAGVTGLADFGRDDLLLGLCAAGAPCGDLAREVLSSAGITPVIDTVEPNVRSLVTKVAAAELDAAIVYATDVTGSDSEVEGLDIESEHSPVAFYPIAVVTDGPNPEGAAAFVEFVLSPAGREILAEYGFGSP